MKRFICFLSVLIILAVFSVPAFVSSAAIDQKTHIIDNAGLFDSDQKEKIANRIDKLIEKFGYDFLLLTFDESNTDLNSSMSDASFEYYAAEYYDQHGYGRDSDGNYITGAVYMLYVYESSTGRHYVSSIVGVDGKCEDEIYDHYDAILDAADPDLRSQNYSAAVLSLLDKLSDVYAHKLTLGQIAVCTGLALLIGFIPAKIHISSLVSQMKVTTAKYAADYLVNGSFKLRNRKDSFLYRNVTRVARSTSSSSGGGSHGHTSSGRSYSGGSHRG